MNLSCLLLDISSVDLSLRSALRCFESLCLNQFCVSYLLILLLLFLHYLQLLFFKHFHACLLKSLEDKYIKHGLNFFIKVEEFSVPIKDLSCLAVLLCWHLWLEERNRWSIKIELSSDTLLVSWWLVSKLFDVLICLNIHMLSAWDWFWCWDISVWVLWYNTLWSLQSK